MTSDDALKVWFVRDVLPLEPALTQFLRRNWRDSHEIDDLRQEVYAKAYQAARNQIPLNTKPFMFAIARNHLIDRARRGRIVSFDLVADLETVPLSAETLTPERITSAREELKRVQAGMDLLPARCRQVMMMRKIEGLSQKAVAARLGVTVAAVEQQTTRGMRFLVSFMLGGETVSPRSGLLDSEDAEANR